MGHITQTFALCELFAQQKQPLTPVAFVVTNCSLSKHALLREHYRCPVIEMPSLRFYLNAAGEVSSLHTGVSALFDLRDCQRSVKQLAGLIAETQPDLVINFYEALGGLYRLQHRTKLPWISVAHQYMVHHPSYTRRSRWDPQRRVLSLLTRLTGIGSTLRVALSFYPAASRGNIFVTAPLLRQNVLTATPSTGDHLLAYLNNGTHLAKLLRYCERHPRQLVRCFCPDRPAAAPANFEWHTPDWTCYVQELITCRGLIATSGFESMAEAGVLNKPAVVIPLENHLEQALNAHDAMRHRLVAHTVAPEGEIPDSDWQPLRPAGEYRNFVVHENRRLVDRLQAVLKPQTTTAPATAAFATVAG